MNVQEKIKHLEHKCEVAEANLRTIHFLMKIALEHLKCIVTATKYAKDGKEAYNTLKIVREELAVVRNIYEQSLKTKTHDITVIMFTEKLKELKKQYNNGEIGRLEYIRKGNEYKKRIAS